MGGSGKGAHTLRTSSERASSPGSSAGQSCAHFSGPLRWPEDGAAEPEAAQDDGHYPHVASECLTRGQCDFGTEFLVPVSFNQLHVKPHVACGYSTVQNRRGSFRSLPPLKCSN